MGVVYKAEDTKLRRMVALKFLRPDVLGSDDHKARFIHEAQAAASLDHPNICTVYEIDEADGQTFIVMSYLEGQTLRDKVDDRPLKLEEALEIAAQVARGLAAAHEKGVVHRDVKCANIMLTSPPPGHETQAKILDFGLAQIHDRSTITPSGATLGTADYMSPEQTKGGKVDHRSDLWSLGVVVYEMVTGRRPFLGHHRYAILYSILNEEPEPITALRAGVPMELEWIVSKALAKDVSERYQSASEMAVDFTTQRRKLVSGKTAVLTSRGTAIRQTGGDSPTAPGDPVNHPLVSYRVTENLSSKGHGIVYRAEDVQQRPVLIRVASEETERQQNLRRRVLSSVGLGAMVVLLAIIAALFLQVPDAVPETPLRRFAIAAPDGTTYAAISPNGRHICYLAGNASGNLWIQDLDREKPRQIAGTEGAQAPFWSPDSNFVAFVARNNLKKVPVLEGLPITVCSMTGSPTDFHGTWSPDGTSIVWSSRFSSGGPSRLYQVPALGGDPRLMIEPEELEVDKGFYNPHFLPFEAGGRALMYAVGSPSSTEIVVYNLETNQRVTLGTGAYPIYSSPTGHLLYQPSRIDFSILWALPFSLETLRSTGEPFPIAQNVAFASVAADGTLAYLRSRGRVQPQLALRDRSGRKLQDIGQPQQNILYSSWSPNGHYVAVRGLEDSNSETDIWIHDTARAIKTRLTFDSAHDTRPIWSATGKEVIFASSRRGNYDIFTKPADGSGEAKALVATPLPEAPNDYSRDGHYLIYQVTDPKTELDIWYMKLNQKGDSNKAVPYLQTRFQERQAKFSPDGRFVAYGSDESGRYEIYVRRFPEGSGKFKVSRNGGTQPRWSRDGRELFYVEGNRLIAVEVATKPDFSAASMEQLFSSPGLVGGSMANYDVSVDGKSFVLVEPVEAVQAPAVRVVQNWFAEFRDREQD